MKKITLLLLGLLAMTSASAVENEYVPLVREGVVWEYVGFRQDDDENPIYTLYTLEFNGTTTIDGKLYYKIYRTDYDKQGNAQEPYFVTFVREENKVVTVYNTTNEEDEYFYFTYWFMMPKTLYDFSKPMFLPDEAYIPFGDEGPYDYNTNYTTYSSIDIEVGESVRKGYFIDHGNEYESFKTIEGIGVDCDFGDLLIPYRTYYTGFNPMASLAAVYENGELVYKGRAFDKAQKLKYPVEGDADGDGIVTSADITLIYSYLLGDYMLNPDVDYNFENCDIDGDGSITSADVTAVYNYLLTGENNNDSSVTTYTVNGVSFNMIKVKGGTFMMGCDEDDEEATDYDKPAHQVTLSDYSLGQTEVTQELWRAVMGINSMSVFQSDKRPVESVSHYQCEQFIDKLNELTGLNFRLPTEAEWEFAACGGNKSKGYKYSGSDDVETVAWYYDNSYFQDDTNPDFGTHIVGFKEPNELGLYDMSGNVYEWCADFANHYKPEPQTNPVGNEYSNSFIIRGGGWNSTSTNCRVKIRKTQDNLGGWFIGFRLAL